MIKFGLFICTGFILVYDGSSLMDEYGSFWGPCPEQPIDSSLSNTVSDVRGKWYTHWVLGQYSPWKDSECQSNEIHFYELQNITVVTKFSNPATRIQIEWDGGVRIVDAIAGKFIFDYNMDDWILSQNTVFLQNFPQGVALVWTCMEFYSFHFESIAILTKYLDPQDSRIDYRIYENMNNTLWNNGISPSWFEQINQSNCE